MGDFRFFEAAKLDFFSFHHNPDLNIHNALTQKAKLALYHLSTPSHNEYITILLNKKAPPVGGAFHLCRFSFISSDTFFHSRC